MNSEIVFQSRISSQHPYHECQQAARVASRPAFAALHRATHKSTSSSLETWHWTSRGGAVSHPADGWRKYIDTDWLRDALWTPASAGTTDCWFHPLHHIIVHIGISWHFCSCVPASSAQGAFNWSLFSKCSRTCASQRVFGGTSYWGCIMQLSHLH